MRLALRLVDYGIVDFELAKGKTYAFSTLPDARYREIWIRVSLSVLN
jgi:hypothetical protein